MNDGQYLVVRKTGLGFDVVFNGKAATHLSYDEALGLVSAIIMPERRPCLHWLEPYKQNNQ